MIRQRNITVGTDLVKRAGAEIDIDSNQDARPECLIGRLARRRRHFWRDRRRSASILPIR